MVVKQVCCGGIAILRNHHLRLHVYSFKHSCPLEAYLREISDVDPARAFMQGSQCQNKSSNHPTQFVIQLWPSHNSVIGGQSTVWSRMHRLFCWRIMAIRSLPATMVVAVSNRDYWGWILLMLMTIPMGFPSKQCLFVVTLLRIGLDSTAYLQLRLQLLWWLLES